MSENTRGRRGSLERKPHFWFAVMSSAGLLAGDSERRFGGQEAEFLGFERGGRSKM